MHIILDITLVAIVAFSVWRGFRNKLVVTVFGVGAVVICLIAANLISSAYSREFAGILDPFVGGLVDSSVSEVLAPDDGGKAGEWGVTDQKDVYEVGRAALVRLGIASAAAGKLAAETGREITVPGQRMADNLAEKLVAVIAYVVVFSTVFILTYIIFAAIGNLLNLTLAIPGFELLDQIGGAVLGFARGVVIILFIACILRYIGVLIPDGVLDGTLLTKWLVNRNLLADLLGV